MATAKARRGGNNESNGGCLDDGGGCVADGCSNGSGNGDRSGNGSNETAAMAD